MRRNYVIARRLATVGLSRVHDLGVKNMTVILRSEARKDLAYLSRSTTHVDPSLRSGCQGLPLAMYAIRQFKRKGRGLVATQEIAAGAAIVTCPVIVYDDEDAGRISKTRLGDYNFRFGARQNRACIVLGVISLCNHAEDPNAEVVCHEAELTVTLVALRAIAEGEEICIRYRRPLWFTPAA